LNSILIPLELYLTEKSAALSILPILGTVFQEKASIINKLNCDPETLKHSLGSFRDNFFLISLELWDKLDTYKTKEEIEKSISTFIDKFNTLEITPKVQTTESKVQTTEPTALVHELAKLLEKIPSSLKNSVLQKIINQLFPKLPELLGSLQETIENFTKFIYSESHCLTAVHLENAMQSIRALEHRCLDSIQAVHDNKDLLITDKAEIYEALILSVTETLHRNHEKLEEASIKKEPNSAIDERDQLKRQIQKLEEENKQLQEKKRTLTFFPPFSNSQPTAQQSSPKNNHN